MRDPRVGERTDRSRVTITGRGPQDELYLERPLSPELVEKRATVNGWSLRCLGGGMWGEGQPFAVRGLSCALEGREAAPKKVEPVR